MQFSETLWNRFAVLRVQEMRVAEQKADASGNSFATMMQRAGEAVAEAAQNRWMKLQTLVLCGPGNNGGDGFVAAEALRKAGWPVRVAAMEASASSPEARAAREAWQGETLAFTPEALVGIELVIDGIFGTGLTRAPTGAAAAMIEAVRKTGLPVLAIDLPSGVETDSGQVFEPAIQAELTVTFARKKPAHLLLPGALLCGRVEKADIGVSENLVAEGAPMVAENVDALWKAAFPSLKPGGHKYDRGHALLRGGDEMTGAARLAARAAQRIGAGLVTLVGGGKAYPIYAVALESAIVKEETGGIWKQAVTDARHTVLLIGPGLGLDPSMRTAVLEALASRKPCVVDADGLSLFADDPQTLLDALHDQCVITPHEGEFARLFGKDSDPAQSKIDRTLAAARNAGCVVLLKGADTVIASPSGRCLVNRNAPPWLATAGAGDVLAGMILGLLAQKSEAFEAAGIAASIHGAIATHLGRGLIAEDLVESLPTFMKMSEEKPVD